MRTYKNKNESLKIETVQVERTNGSVVPGFSLIISIGDQEFCIGDGLRLIEQLANHSANLGVSVPWPTSNPFTFTNVTAQ